MKYLCHYTNNIAAKKILETMTLRLGKICNSNDLIEVKKFASFLPFNDIDKSIEEGKRIEKKLSSYLNKILQVICFAEGEIKNICCDIDDDGEEVEIEDDDIHYAKLEDFSERPPYYLPRMWAQYSKNQKGVCFIFNKSKIIQQFEEQLCDDYYFKYKEIEYIDFMKNDVLLQQAVTQIYSYNGCNLKTKAFIEQYLNSYADRNYFYKDINWRDEMEYRFLVWNKASNNDYHNKLININNESLIGVVFGMNNRDDEILRLAEKNKVKNTLQLLMQGALFAIAKVD
jgi:hypothetical protein